MKEFNVNIIEKQVYAKLYSHMVDQMLNVIAEQMDSEGQYDAAVEAKLCSIKSTDYNLQALFVETAMQPEALCKLFEDSKLTVEDLYHETHWVDTVADYISAHPELIKKLESLCTTATVRIPFVIYPSYSAQVAEGACEKDIPKGTVVIVIDQRGDRVEVLLADGTRCNVKKYFLNL